MTFLALKNWLKPLQRQAQVGRRRPPPHARGLRRRIVPGLETLEDRCLLSGGITLTPSAPAPQLVGAPITWTAMVADAPTGIVYQFSVGSPGGPFQMVRDFSPDDHFSWAPMQEGTYRIRVAVKDGFAASDTQSAVVPDEVGSRVTGGQPVITPTANPLVALYSVPPGPIGTVHVEFAVAGDNPSWRSTNELRSVPSRSTNFFVAGMLPNTTYEMRDVFSDGTASAPLLFTTGSLPSNLVFPTFTVQQPPGPGSDLDQDMIFHGHAFATDLSGHLVWYYNISQAGLTQIASGSLVPGGTVLLQGADQYAAKPVTLDVVREIDLAGDTVRETNLDAVNAQLTAMGHDVTYGFTHDVQRLPNGQTAVLGLTERTVNINGTPTNYVGAVVIVLDQNFQVAWVWGSFDHLDVNRGPVLGEVINPGSADPDSAVPNLPAVDWLHANALSGSPGDGNLILSLRHQDWVIKIDYENGAGDGHVIWRLGQGGDFTVNSADPNPWFSHQHDAHFIDDHTMILFDNGNTRRASDPTADSRGQVWKIDEQTLTATLELNVDMGSYSPMFGAAQRLSNGDYSFLSGAQGTAAKQLGQAIEVRPDGSKAYVLAENKWEYRSFRMRTLYEGISDQLAPGSGGDTSPDFGGRLGQSGGNGLPGAGVPAGGAGLGANSGTGSSAPLTAAEGAGQGDTDDADATLGGLPLELGPAEPGVTSPPRAAPAVSVPSGGPALPLAAQVTALPQAPAVAPSEQPTGGSGGAGGSDGQGVGGGLYLTPGGVACADLWTVIFPNHASSGSDDVFGDLGRC